MTLTASALAVAPATVSSVQFLLDGQPLGPLVTTAPYTFGWTVGSTVLGSHLLSAQAIDSAGNQATAPSVPISVVSVNTGALAIDTQSVQTGHGAVTTAAFSTSVVGDQLVALVAADGSSTANQTATVTGAGLTWSLVKRSDAQLGTVEIWAATAPTILHGVTVTATPGQGGSYDQQLVVLALENAGGVGASAIGSGPSGAPGVSVTSTAAGSLTFAVGDDWSKAIGRTPTPLFQWIDSTSGNTFWVQSAAPTTTAGQVVTLASTAPTADRWNLAAVDIVPSGTVPPPPDNMPPTVNITNPTVGQTGRTVPVAATASDNVAVASVQFLLDGNPLGAPVTAPPYAVQWDTTTATNAGHTLSARATDTSGNIGTATGVAVTVQNPAPPSPACFRWTSVFRATDMAQRCRPCSSRRSPERRCWHSSALTALQAPASSRRPSVERGSPGRLSSGPMRKRATLRSGRHRLQPS